MEPCFWDNCENTAELVDEDGLYYCMRCIEYEIANCHTASTIDDFKVLDWVEYPENGLNK